MNLQTRQSNVLHCKHLLKFDCFAFTCPWIIIMYSFIEKKERKRERDGEREGGTKGRKVYK